MSTIRVSKRHRYAVVDRRAINDTRLSWSARGLLVWALDKPDDYKLTREEITKQAPEGESAVRRMLKELSDLGYLRRERRRDDAGHFYTETTLYEVPPDEAPPLDGFPPVGDPPADNRPVRDRVLTTESIANAIGGPAAEGESRVDRNGLFRALAEVWTGTGWPVPLNDKSRNFIASALPDLTELGATPAEVHRRAGNYLRLYEKRPTPAALVKHWPSLDAPPPNGKTHQSIPTTQHIAEERKRQQERRERAERLAVD